MANYQPGSLFIQTRGFDPNVPHRGVDFAAPAETPVPAAFDGKVVFSGYQTGTNGESTYGYTVILEHSGPNSTVFYTMYNHMHDRSNMVNVGQQVQAGQTIGTVGNTGNVFGSNLGTHLHFEVLQAKIPTQPLPIIQSADPGYAGPTGLPLGQYRQDPAAFQWPGSGPYNGQHPILNSVIPTGPVTNTFSLTIPYVNSPATQPGPWRPTDVSGVEAGQIAPGVSMDPAKVNGPVSYAAAKQGALLGDYFMPANGNIVPTARQNAQLITWGTVFHDVQATTPPGGTLTNFFKVEPIVSRYTNSLNLQSFGVDPLILDLNGDGVRLTSFQDNLVLFDVDHDGGSKEQTGWVAANTITGGTPPTINTDGIVAQRQKEGWATFLEFCAGFGWGQAPRADAGGVSAPRNPHARLAWCLSGFVTNGRI